jgi:hypothetical protein
MSENQIKKIYITIGSRFGTYVKRKEYALFESTTEIQIAKYFRKQESNRLHMKPSELYWAVFDNLDDEKPRIHSENYIQGNLCSVHTFMMIGV